MRRVYQIAGIAFLLFAILAFSESRKLKYYSSLGPGPGFFPFWVSIFIGILAVAMLYQATFKPQEPMPPDFIASRAGYLRSGAITLALIVTAMLMERLGFRLTMLCFYLFLLIALGRRNPFVTLVVAVIGSVGVFHVFVEWLKVPLPVGMFGF